MLGTATTAAAATTLRPATHTKSLHLLRALLREASYLPDVTARNYFRRYIVARFKAYQPRQNATASFDVQAVEKYRHRSFKRRDEAIINARAAQQLGKAQKGLNYLRRANQGEGPCLKKVLLFAYGRLGRRKYALLDDLLQPDPTWPAVPAPLQQLYNSNLRCLQYFEAPIVRDKNSNVMNISNRYPRLRAVLTSQVQQGVALGRPPKRPYLNTPVLNTWRRRMPIKRAVNNVRRWYAKTMTKLLPALPAEEWDRLDAMSKGRQHISFVRRRTPAAALSSEDTPEEIGLEQLVQHSLAMDKLSKAERPQGMDRPHRLTVRYMQRLYSRLLTLCCKLDYNEKSKRWDTVWGELDQTAKPASYNVPVDDALFADAPPTGSNRKRGPEATSKLSPLPRKDDGGVLRFPFYAEWLPETHPMRIELDKFKKQRKAALAQSDALGPP
ncbi:hypothetical protein E8E13_010907 [Curvularia kusanoi]|uniref:LYR motif-containing protein Cup1-like N-terminal domain-containing protein n=1 Tax=Curvularia kusanoi TaxID=90978 RepID=A0A9P4TJG9_CURKU|nr:hypothetical protein E8E13_010907 [Curvularia kusanoi]